MVFHFLTNSAGGGWFVVCFVFFFVFLGCLGVWLRFFFFFLYADGFLSRQHLSRRRKLGKAAVVRVVLECGGVKVPFGL